MASGGQQAQLPTLMCALASETEDAQPSAKPCTCRRSASARSCDRPSQLLVASTQLCGKAPAAASWLQSESVAGYLYYCCRLSKFFRWLEASQPMPTFGPKYADRQIPKHGCRWSAVCDLRILECQYGGIQQTQALQRMLPSYSHELSKLLRSVGVCSFACTCPWAVTAMLKQAAKLNNRRSKNFTQDHSARIWLAELSCQRVLPLHSRQHIVGNAAGVHQARLRPPLVSRHDRIHMPKVGLIRIRTHCAREPLSRAGHSVHKQ